MAVTDAEKEAIKKLNVGGVDTAKTPKANFKNEGTEVEGKILACNQRSGEKNGKSWTRFVITLDNQIDYGTFDTTLGNLAIQAKKENASIKIKFANNGKGNNIEDIEIIKEVNR